jgi:hypothetical protein
LERDRSIAKTTRSLLQDADVEQLASAKALLEAAQQEADPAPDALADQIAGLGAAVAGLADEVRRLKGHDYSGWAQVVLALIGLLIAAKMMTAPQPVTDDDIERLVQKLGPTPAAQMTQPSRNAPCWCGSQRKFKRCHGSLIGK